MDSKTEAIRQLLSQFDVKDAIKSLPSLLLNENDALVEFAIHTLRELCERDNSLLLPIVSALSDVSLSGKNLSLAIDISIIALSSCDENEIPFLLRYLLTSIIPEKRIVRTMNQNALRHRDSCSLPFGKPIKQFSKYLQSARSFSQDSNRIESEKIKFYYRFGYVNASHDDGNVIEIVPDRLISSIRKEVMMVSDPILSVVLEVLIEVLPSSSTMSLFLHEISIETDHEISFFDTMILLIACTDTGIIYDSLIATLTNISNDNALPFHSFHQIIEKQKSNEVWRRIVPGILFITNHLIDVHVNCVVEISFREKMFDLVRDLYTNFDWIQQSVIQSLIDVIFPIKLPVINFVTVYPYPIDYQSQETSSIMQSVHRGIFAIDLIAALLSCRADIGNMMLAKLMERFYMDDSDFVTVPHPLILSRIIMKLVLASEGCSACIDTIHILVKKFLSSVSESNHSLLRLLSDCEAEFQLSSYSIVTASSFRRKVMKGDSQRMHIRRVALILMNSLTRIQIRNHSLWEASSFLLLARAIPSINDESIFDVVDMLVTMLLELSVYPDSTHNTQSSNSSSKEQSTMRNGETIRDLIRKCLVLLKSTCPLVILPKTLSELQSTMLEDLASVIHLNQRLDIESVNTSRKRRISEVENTLVWPIHRYSKRLIDSFNVIDSNRFSYSNPLNDLLFIDDGFLWMILNTSFLLNYYDNRENDCVNQVIAVSQTLNDDSVNHTSKEPRTPLSKSNNIESYSVFPIWQLSALLQFEAVHEIIINEDCSNIWLLTRNCIERVMSSGVVLGRLLSSEVIGREKNEHIDEDANIHRVLSLISQARSQLMLCVAAIEKTISQNESMKKNKRLRRTLGNSIASGDRLLNEIDHSDSEDSIDDSSVASNDIASSLQGMKIWTERLKVWSNYLNQIARLIPSKPLINLLLALTKESNNNYQCFTDLGLELVLLLRDRIVPVDSSTGYVPDSEEKFVLFCCDNRFFPQCAESYYRLSNIKVDADSFDSIVSALIQLIPVICNEINRLRREEARQKHVDAGYPCDNLRGEMLNSKGMSIYLIIVTQLLKQHVESPRIACRSIDNNLPFAIYEVIETNIPVLEDPVLTLQCLRVLHTISEGKKLNKRFSCLCWTMFRAVYTDCVFQSSSTSKHSSETDLISLALTISSSRWRWNVIRDCVELSQYCCLSLSLDCVSSIHQQIKKLFQRLLGLRSTYPLMPDKDSRSMFVCSSRGSSRYIDTITGETCRKVLYLNWFLNESNNHRILGIAFLLREFYQSIVSISNDSPARVQKKSSGRPLTSLNGDSNSARNGTNVCGNIQNRSIKNKSKVYLSSPPSTVRSAVSSNDTRDQSVFSIYSNRVDRMNIDETSMDSFVWSMASLPVTIMEFKPIVLSKEDMSLSTGPYDDYITIAKVFVWSLNRLIDTINATSPKRQIALLTVAGRVSKVMTIAMVDAISRMMTWRTHLKQKFDGDTLGTMNDKPRIDLGSLEYLCDPITWTRRALKTTIRLCDDNQERVKKLSRLSGARILVKIMQSTKTFALKSISKIDRLASLNLSNLDVEEAIQELQTDWDAKMKSAVTNFARTATQMNTSKITMDLFDPVESLNKSLNETIADSDRLSIGYVDSMSDDEEEDQLLQEEFEIQNGGENHEGWNLYEDVSESLY